MNSDKAVLLLDLGGVLADLGDPVNAMGLDMSLEEFWETWTSSEVVRALETGRMGVADFLATIPEELGYVGDAPFSRRFYEWQLRLFPGVDDLIRNAAHDYRVALLSNTNEIHWGQVNESTDTFTMFDQVFLSYETGHLKPSLAAFHQVLEFFECSPGEVIFLDDSEPNIAAALKLGIDARKVVGVTELEQQLVRCTGFGQ